MPTVLIVEDEEANGFPAHWSYLVSAENGDLLESQDLRMGQSRQASALVYPTNPLASDVVPVTPYEGSRSRHLHLYLKVRSTPERFPRRPGVAARRPLG